MAKSNRRNISDNDIRSAELDESLDPPYSDAEDLAEESAFYGNIEHVFGRICEDEPEPTLSAETALVPVEPIMPPIPVEPIREPSLGDDAEEPPMDVVQSLWRFKWSLVATFLVVSIMLLWLIWSRTTLQYQARGEIRIEPIIVPLVYNTPENGPRPFYSSFVNTQVSIIRSPRILDPVLARPDIQATMWYQIPKMSLIQKLRGEAASPYERLRDTLVVEPRRGTEVVDISLACEAPKDAEIIVNALLDQYIENVGHVTDSSNNEVFGALLKRYEVKQQELEVQGSRLAELHERVGTGDPQGRVAAKQSLLDGMKAQLDDLRERQKLLQWTLDRQNGVAQARDTRDANGVARGPIFPSETKPKYHQDAEWVRLNDLVMTLRHDIGTTSMGPRHPNLMKLQNDLAFQEDRLVRRERQLDEQWVDAQRLLGAGSLLAGGATTAGSSGAASVSPLLPLGDQIERLKYEERLLEADYQQEQAAFDELFALVQQIKRETDAMAHTQGISDAVRQRLEQANMESDRPGDISILTRAIAPTEPFQDRRIAFSCISLVLGLGLGGSLALIRAQRNQTIFTPKDLPVRMREPFLGKIPMIRTKKLLGQALWQEIEQNKYLMVEPIRVMRTILLSRLSRRGHSAVLVSSAMPGTGKSSFTVMLGKSLAEGGKRVLLIDTDVHKKTLSRRFKLADHAGFIESVRDQEIERDWIVQTETPGLSILPAGKVEKGKIALELIANGALRSCLDQLSARSDYDLILMDCPAILTIANTIIMANQVDGIIMVERERVSHRGNVARALARLASSGGRLVGTVFVGSHKNESAGYGTGYGYGNGTKTSA